VNEFEGRPLARPGRDLDDQGLGFDVGTLFHRRQVLRLLGVGTGVGVLGTACSSSDSGSSGSSGADTGGSAGRVTDEIPQETAGPYPGDGSNGPDVLERSGVVRSDIRSSFGGATGTAQGVPMTLTLTVLDLANDGRPFTGTAVYVWQCDREGRYSLYSQGITQENYLRGVQIADDAGQVRYTSIFPACYPGRWPHIHFEVYAAEADITDSAKAITTSQVALPKDTCDTVYATAGYEASVRTFARVTLATDNVFRDDGGVTQLATVTGDTATGYTVSLTVGVAR
jgi:protocatechuate 3,4-dioxygenase beta subunit